MKSDYEITQDLFSKEVDEETRPKRFAIATNALMVLHDDSERYLLMVNVDPVKINKWYPVFVSHNSLYAFNANDYEKLIEEFTDASNEHGFSITSRRSACITYLEKFISSTFEVNRIDKIDEDRYWIKYSKSQDIWTMYLFENYAFFVDKISVPQRDDIALIPLKNNLAWIETGVFAGLKIVDNMYMLLRDEKFRKLLQTE